jgi:hypothetical protein
MRSQRKNRRRSRRLLLRPYRAVKDIDVGAIPRTMRQQYVRAIVRDVIWGHRS